MSQHVSSYSETHYANRDSFQMDGSTWSKGRNVLSFIALVAIIACAAGYFTDPARLFQSYMVAFSLVTATALGAFFFVMVQFLSGSAWSVTVRRIMENIMITIPMCALLFIPVLVGMKDIFPWMDHALMFSTDQLKGKTFYLSPTYFTLRSVAYFVLWSIWVIALYRQSTRQDTERSIRRMHVASRWSAPGLFLCVVVGTLAAYDWLMSLDPGWYSTIFGLYFLAGGALTFMSIVVLVSLGFRRAGILTNSITLEHYHDLGKWLFALTAFYTYIAFAQYLLIWYANIPDETQWYRHRDAGSWLYVALAMPFLRFIVPFFTLLSRPAKRSLGVIGFIAAWSIASEWIDLYWVVMPAYYKNGPQVSWLDFATMALTVSVCGLVFWSKFKRHKMVPVGDLRFEQSLHFENA